MGEEKWGLRGDMWPGDLTHTCDIVIIMRIMYLVCILFLAHCWNLLNADSDKGVFYYVSEVTPSVGVVTRVIKQVISNWNFQFISWILERDWLEVGSIPKGQWFNQSHLCNEASMNPQEDRSQRAS